MKEWRLIVKQNGEAASSYELPRFHRVYAGYDPSADICLNTIQVPFRHILIERNWGNPRLRLTQEVASSLTGSSRLKKDWRTKLYEGREFEIDGNCAFKIEDVDFLIEEVQPLPLEKLPEHKDEVARRHSQIAALSSMAGLLLLFLVSWIIDLIIPEANKELAQQEIQKVTLVEAKKVFKQPDPTPVEIVEPMEAKVTEVAKTPEPQEKPSKRAKNTKAVAQKAPGKTFGNKPRDVRNMGLLALQTVKNAPSSASLPVASSTPRKAAPSHAVALGTGRAEFGLGNGDDSNHVQIAKLGSISGDAYSGDLGNRIRGQSGAAIRLARKEVEIRGALDPAVIRQIIEERLSEIRYCYETALLKHQGLEGKIAATWTIQSDGSVGDLGSASDQIKAEILHPCIRRQISRWKFPSPKGGGVVHVKYPFVFSPVGERQ